MAKQGNEEEKQYLVDKVILHELENSDAYDLKGLVGPIIAEGKKKLLSARASGLAATLLDEDKKRLGQLINPFFKRYDIDCDMSITINELRTLMGDLGGLFGFSEEVDAATLMALLDADGNEEISWQEWSHACAVWLADMGE